MNHRPFEDWLLEDQPLTSEQKRELQTHLRVCTSCTAIAESNLALHSTRRVSPSAGFSERFQVRLARRRREGKFRQVIGAVILILAGMALLDFLAGPLIQEVLQSPAQWITTAVGYVLFLVTSIQVLSEVGSILLQVFPAVIPPIDWLVVALIGGGLGFLWIISIWRFSHRPQGV